MAGISNLTKHIQGVRSYQIVPISPVSVNSFLQLTQLAPEQFEGTVESNSIFVTYGVVGNVEPNNIFDDFQPESDSDFWLKIVFDHENGSSITSVEIEFGAETPESDSPDTETGNPGNEFFFHLGHVFLDNGQIDSIVNSGNGSLGHFTFTVGQICVTDEYQDELRDLRNIGFYRLQTG